MRVRSSILSRRRPCAGTGAGRSIAAGVSGVNVCDDQSFTFGKTSIWVSGVERDDEDLSFTLNLPRSVMATIKEVRFFDGAGQPLEGRQTGSPRPAPP